MNILHGFQTMKHSRTRNRAPTLIVVSRNPLPFWIRNLVERNLNVWRTRNLRITAGNHIPYFEALKKMQGIFKSTENHIYWLACYIFNYMLRCLDLKNILIWPGFSHFFSRDFFLETTCAPSGSVCACHVAWNLHYAHAHCSLEGAHACNVAWWLKFSSPRRYLPTEEKKIKQRKNWKENQFSGF